MDIFEKTAFAYLKGIIANDEIRSVLPLIQPKDGIDASAITFVHEMDNYGYLVDHDVYKYMMASTKTASRVLELAKESVGAHVNHKALYPNFPQQVMDTPKQRLYLNSLLYYWTDNEERPPLENINERPPLEDINDKTKISLVSMQDVKQYFLNLLASKTSIPVSLTKFIDEGLERRWHEELEGKIVFKETLCRVAVHKIKKDESIDDVIETTTDVLRVLAALSDQDIELKQKVRIRSIKRKQRKIILDALERVINVDDVKKYSGLWKLAFHMLHVGEYGGKVAQIAKRYREENNVETYDTIVSEAIKKGDVETAMNKLSIKPPLFARSLDKFLRSAGEIGEEKVLDKFETIVRKVDTKILLQLLGHFKTRDQTMGKRVVVTAGSKGKTLLASELEPIDSKLREKVVDVITSTLVSTFEEKKLLEDKKSVFIEPELSTVLLPLQLASVSENKRTVARGSKLSMDVSPEDISKSTIRLFIYWVGVDIDLSAYFVNEDFTKASHISYTNLKESYACHSGDITWAPSGASEFIDVDMEKALENGFRYISMCVFVYRGVEFSMHETCFAGYMLRDEVNGGEIYEPSTVKNKFDLTTDSRRAIPCLFDMKERQVIWIDSDSPSIVNLPNNIEANAKNCQDLIKSFLVLDKKKVNITELLELHVHATPGCKIVDKKEDADFVVGLGDGDLDALDFTEINSRWI